MIEQFRSKPIPIASAEEPFRMVALPQSTTFRCTAANDALGPGGDIDLAHSMTPRRRMRAGVFDAVVLLF
jgi:hypothetical protein